MKKFLKIALIFIIVINMYLLSYTANAKDIWQSGDKFLDIGKQEQTLGTWIGQGFSKITIKEVIDFIWGIGLLVVFISTVVLGIKYILVLPSEKSRLKQATTPYIVGVVIIFGALTIWKFIIQILDVKLT